MTFLEWIERLTIILWLVLAGLLLFAFSTLAQVTFTVNCPPDCDITIKINAPPAPPSGLFVSPVGSGTSCTSAAPCALSRIAAAAQPGDTWILKPGTYNGSGSVLFINGRSGTATQRIRVTAETPGTATLQGDGASGHVLRVNSSNYWDFDNLVVRNRDNPGNSGSNASIIGTFNSNNLTFKKMIATDGNTYGNNDGVLLQGTNILFEDSDVLRSARNFLACYPQSTSAVTIRRVYLGQPLLDHSNSGPGDGFVFYSCYGSANDNSIAEGLIGYGFTGWGDNNRVAGIIALDNNGGVFNGTASSTTDQGKDFHLNGYVGIRNNNTCLYVRAVGAYVLDDLFCVANQIVLEGVPVTITNAVTVPSANCYLKNSTLYTPGGAKLWNSATGKMNFGPVVVQGVNSPSTGLVRDTVGQRLNVTPSCLPPGY